MASPVYTVLLGEVSFSTGSGILVSSPPAGFRYVVTDMDAHNQDPPAPEALAGFDVQDFNGCFVWAVNTFAFRGPTYHWRGRQVVDVGGELDYDIGDTGWSIRASGFQLTLP